jgi:hypothetical protein
VGTGTHTDNIFVEKDVRCGKDLLSCLHRCENLLKRQTSPAVKLMVIDSIAYIFRFALCESQILLLDYLSNI